MELCCHLYIGGGDPSLTFVLVKWSVSAHSNTVQDGCGTDSKYPGRKAGPRLRAGPWGVLGGTVC